MTDTNESESRCMIIKSTYRDGASESVTFMAPTAAECAEMAIMYGGSRHIEGLPRREDGWAS